MKKKQLFVKIIDVINNKYFLKEEIKKGFENKQKNSITCYTASYC